MTTSENQLFPGETFQVHFSSMQDGELFWDGSFSDVADAALNHDKDYKPRQSTVSKFFAGAGITDKLTINRRDVKTGRLERIPAPVDAKDLLLAIRAYADGNGSQLWLLIEAELIGEQGSFDIESTKEQIAYTGK